MDWGWLPATALYIMGILILAITFKHHINSKSSQRIKKDPFERDHQAQFTRNKPLDQELFLSVDFEAIPTTENDECQKVYNTLIQFKMRPMMNLKGKDNTEIKLMYGPQAINKIAGYERNYFLFMNTLYQYSHILFINHYLFESEAALELGIAYDCDLSKAYLLLIEIYKTLDQHDKLEILIKKIEHEMKESPLLEKVRDSL